MKRLLAVACIALAAASSAAAVSSPPSRSGGGYRNMDAKLSAAAEVPPPAVAAPKAAGTFHATGAFTCKNGEKNCVSKPGKMTWKLTFSGLTGRALAAHLHFGKRGVAGAVAIPLCGPCPAGAHGTLTMTRKVWDAAGANGVYVNVHTAKNPNGEIRGQVVLSAVL